MTTEKQSHRVAEEPPVRAITYTGDDKSQAAAAATDPHAAEAKEPAAEAKPSRKTAAKE